MIHRTAACRLYCTAFPHESDLALDRTTRSMVVVGCNNFDIAGLQTPQLPCLMFDRDVTPIRPIVLRRHAPRAPRAPAHRRGLLPDARRTRALSGTARRDSIRHDRIGRAERASKTRVATLRTTGLKARRSGPWSAVAHSHSRGSASGSGLLAISKPWSTRADVVSAQRRLRRWLRLRYGRVAYPPKWNSSSDPVPPMA